MRARAARRFIAAQIFEPSSRTAAREDARRTRSLVLPSRSISSVTGSKRWPPKSAGTKKYSAASNAVSRARVVPRAIWFQVIHSLASDWPVNPRPAERSSASTRR